jgi:hypothetical protein
MHCKNSSKIIPSDPPRIISSREWMHELLSYPRRDDKAAKQLIREISEDLIK